MRYLIFSDLHLHRWPYGAATDKDGRHSRLADLLRILDTVGEIAAEQNVNSVLFAGDFFHRPWADAEMAEEVRSRIWAFKGPIVVIAGNHDQIARRSWRARMTSIIPSGHFGNVLGAEDYSDDPRTRWAERLLSGKKPDVFIMHQGILGAKMSKDFCSENEQDLSLAEARQLASKLVIAGHFHQPQLFDQQEPVVLIPGAPVQHTWGDAGQERGVWIANVDEKVDVDFLALDGFPKFVDLKPQEREPSIEDEVAGNFVRVTLPEEAVDKWSKALGVWRQTARHVELVVERRERKAEQRLERPKGCDVWTPEAMVRAYAGKFAAESDRTGIEKEGLAIISGISNGR